MISVLYAPIFVRMYKGLRADAKEDVKEKITLFKDKKNHEKLKVHKLKGKLKKFYSFRVNYDLRIVFEYKDKKTVYLLYVGSHDESYR